MRRSIRYGALSVLCALAISCGATPAEIDLGNVPDAMSNSPRIIALKFLAQAAKSSDVLIFEMEFNDLDGDTGLGRLSVYVNGEVAPLAESNLRPIFLQNDTSPSSTSAKLRVVTQLTFKSAIAKGERAFFEIGFQLTDALGHKSNIATARLFVESVN